MPSTVWWSTLYLGNLAEMDTDEASFSVEDNSPLLTTFGGPNDPLAKNIVDVQSHSGDSNTAISSDNYGTSDTVTYDLGSGLVTANVDSVIVVHGEVSFYGGSTWESNMGVFQTDNGDTFLLALDSQPQLGSAGIESITFSQPMTSDFSGIEQTTKDDVDFVCFGPGTLIETPRGPRRADKLEVGDYLTTLDDGPMPIRWIGKRRVKFPEPHSAQPVLVAEGALGTDLPKRDLLVSPHHRVLIESDPAHIFHDPRGALVPAKALTRQKGIRIARGRREITYFNFLLPRHAVLIAEGIAVESLYPGPQVWAGLSGRDRSGWMRLAAESRVTCVPPARLMLSVQEARAGLGDGTLSLPKRAPAPVSWSARSRRRNSGQQTLRPIAG